MSTFDTTPRIVRHQAGSSVLTRVAQGALVVLSIALVCLLAPSLASETAATSTELQPLWRNDMLARS